MKEAKWNTKPDNWTWKYVESSWRRKVELRAEMVQNTNAIFFQI